MNVAEPKGQSSSVSAGAYPTPDAIDLSCRLTLGVIFLSAAVWAVVAALFGLIASIKFHSPNFLADPAWLTYGRVRSASATAWIYGFFVPGGVGVALWIFARLGRTLLKARLLALSGTILWGIGVLIGFAGILRGDSSGFPNLEIPAYAATVLFIGYVTMAVSAALTFHSREPGPLFVSHWFLFTALFWFAWILSTAAVLLLLFPVRGMTQAVIDWWFSQNLRIVWFDLTGLGLLFYFIPKVYGRELHSRQLALLAYWTLILFAPWGGIPGSAPVPAWMPALAQVADAFACWC